MAKSSVYIVQYSHDTGEFFLNGELENELFIDGSIYDDDYEVWIDFKDEAYMELKNKDIEGVTKLQDALNFINQKR